VAGAWSGFTDRPSFSDAREIAEDISAQYIDGKVDRVEMIYNGYVSAMTQNVSSDVLLPLAAVEQLMEDDGDGEADDVDGDPVFLATSAFMMRRAAELAPTVAFRDIKDVRAIKMAA